MNGNTSLTIASDHTDGHHLSGLTVGAFAGGLAASTLDGTASATTNGSTTINITDGVSVGVFGSGAALSAELEGSIWNAIKGSQFGDNITLPGSEDEQTALLANGGKATVTSNGDITVNATGDSVTVGLAGGGFAAASSGGTGGTSEAHVETGDITLTLGTNAPTLENQDKIALQTTASNLIGAFKTTLGNLSIDSLLDLVDPVTDAVNKSQTNYQGAHVGNVGGSVVIASMPSSVEGTTAIATANSGNITVNLEGGYTVATLGGGMTIASGYGIAEGTKATSDVASTTMNITGGDNVLVMAGGAAYATGSNGQESKVLSQSNVEASTVNMTGGSVDGLFGGGLAIDDTNASGTNASAKTNSVAINIDGGTVNRVDSNGLTSLATGESLGAPSNGTYVNDTADLIGNKDKGNAAIVGTGIATGAQALVSSETVAINLNGGVVNGNVFAGGAATLGGMADVGTATIVLNGTTVEGNIYGGGLVGSKRNNNFENATQYAQASSSVNDVEIVLADGSVQNVYAGGFTHEGSEGVTNTVEKALIRLMATDVFKGEVIDGSGATTATLEITPVQYAFEDGQQISAFDTITAAGAVSNFSYDFGNKVATTLTGGPVDFVALTGTEGKTLALGTDEASGIASIAEGINLTGLTLDVNNGLLSFNADGATAMEIAATAPTQTKAMAYVSGTLDLTNAKVLVGDVESDVNGLYLGKDGTLIADAAAKSSVNGTADTANGTIHFVGVAQDGAQVTIAAAEETNTTVDNVLYKAVQTDNVYTFEARSGEELNEVGLGDFDDSAFLADLVHHDNKGARFIEGFLDQSNGSVTNANRSQQLNAAMNLATAAGVQTAAIDSATVGLDAANKRASIIHDPVEGGVLFAEASGRRTEMGGSADFGEIKSELGGVVVGGEYTTGDWTFGALANVGTGSVKGQGNNAGVDNDVDYYGAQIYTGKRFGQFNVVGQVGYLSTSNDITHSTLGINKADVDADVITVGVRGEMRFDLTANTRIVPYIGLNYLRVGTDGYTTSQGVQVSDVDQNLFTLPVGVKYAGDMKTQSGWAWTPSVDLAYVAAFGDRDVDATTHVGAVGQTTMDVWAESTVRTTIGVKAQKDNFGFGVEAGGAFGSDDTKGLFGQVRVDYRF
ncbi:MAG TPA: autotransporter outer membrane beta-barrel domain-containing protein [Candidatus Aphodousia gallistercoris]|nr:autotransporter outer membrane beta-barrel domain-containing protein [Candidatus Aphodousia gallistercoris]